MTFPSRAVEVGLVAVMLFGSAGSAAAESISVVSLAGSDINLAPGESVPVIVGLSNESADMPASILATILSLSITPSVGGLPSDITILNVSASPNALFGDSAPVSQSSDGTTSVSVGVGPPGSPPELPGSGVAPIFTLDVSASELATGSYSLMLARFTPPGDGSSFLAGVPPLPLPFQNDILAGTEPNSVLLTINVVPEPVTAALAFIGLLAAIDFRR